VGSPPAAPCCCKSRARGGHGPRGRRRAPAEVWPGLQPRSGTEVGRQLGLTLLAKNAQGASKGIGRRPGNSRATSPGQVLRTLARYRSIQLVTRGPQLPEQHHRAGRRRPATSAASDRRAAGQARTNAGRRSAATRASGTAKRQTVEVLLRRQARAPRSRGPMSRRRRCRPTGIATTPQARIARQPPPTVSRSGSCREPTPRPAPRTDSMGSRAVGSQWQIHATRIQWRTISGANRSALDGFRSTPCSLRFPKLADCPAHPGSTSPLTLGRFADATPACPSRWVNGNRPWRFGSPPN